MSIRSSIEESLAGRKHTQIVRMGIDREAEERSKAWFIDAARRLPTFNPMQIFMDKDVRKRSGLEIGKMYMFYYDAIYKNELDYWDTLPLVFPTDYMQGPSGAGMLGINFHYLPRGARAYLLDALYPGATDTRLSASARMESGYHALKVLSDFDIIKPTIHRYVFSKMSKGFIAEIPPDDWAIALQLPLERFVQTAKDKNTKVNKLHVHKGSLSGIKKRWK